MSVQLRKFIVRWRDEEVVIEASSAGAAKTIAARSLHDMNWVKRVGDAFKEMRCRLILIDDAEEVKPNGR